MGDRGDLDRRRIGQLQFEGLVARLAGGEAQSPPVVVDDDADVIGIVERCSRPIERGVVELPLRRGNLPIEVDRRRFLSSAAIAIAGARVAAIDPRVPQTSGTAAFGALMQIDAGVLNVGCADVGPRGGTPVILLHGWPYDIHSYVDVAPRLASAGFRVIVPYLRGYGATRLEERHVLVPVHLVPYAVKM